MNSPYTASHYLCVPYVTREHYYPIELRFDSNIRKHGTLPFQYSKDSNSKASLKTSPKINIEGKKIGHYVPKTVFSMNNFGK